DAVVAGRGRGRVGCPFGQAVEDFQRRPDLAARGRVVFAAKGGEDEGGPGPAGGVVVCGARKAHHGGDGGGVRPFLASRRCKVGQQVAGGVAQGKAGVLGAVRLEQAEGAGKAAGRGGAGAARV